jgi:PAS domain S-box-containing protein
MSSPFVDSPEEIRSYNLEHFFELSADLFCIAGYDGYFRKINSAVSTVLGFSHEELMSRPILSFLHPDDLDITRQLRSELIKGAPLLNYENRYLTKSGDVVWLSWTSMPVPEDEVIYAIAKNITHKKKEEADRNNLLEQFSRINQELKQITYATSHDLRSPVNNLLSLFKLLEANKTEDQESARYFSILKSATEGLKTTINNYVDLLAKKDGLRIVKEAVILEDSLSAVLHSLQSLLKDARATVQFHFKEVPVIHFNRTYMESVFLNLLSNSIKYASPSRKPVIHLHSYQEDGWLKISATDNGLGFDVEKVRNRIFGIKEQFHEHADSKGIGLYLIHSHVTSFGGLVEISSRPDEGTTFILSFKDSAVN